MTAIDPASLTVLEQILRRESLSLLSYIGDAYPWTTTEGSAGLKTLNQLIQQEKQAITDLGRYLIRRRATPPFIGSYPAGFTSWNFIDLKILVPRLLELQQRSINELQADLAKIHDESARKEVERLLAVKKMTLAALESLTANPSVSA